MSGNIHGYSCPWCGKDSHIAIEATMWVSLVPDGSVPHPVNGSHEYDDKAQAICEAVDCGWRGLVGGLVQEPEEGYSYPRLIETTARASYWEVQKGVYQATPPGGAAPKGIGGYANLGSLKRLKGEPRETMWRWR